MQISSICLGLIFSTAGQIGNGHTICKRGISYLFDFYPSDDRLELVLKVSVRPLRLYSGFFVTSKICQDL